jgi:hypothetical protein
MREMTVRTDGHVNATRETRNVNNTHIHCVILRHWDHRILRSMDGPRNGYSATLQI